MDAEQLIKDHEGYRGSIYYDSVGVPTVGFGTALLPGKLVNRRICELLFIEDYTEALNNYEVLRFDLDDVRRAAVLDLLYNLGLSKFMKFENTIDALRSKDFEQAASNLERSKWYGQVKRRGPRICALIRTGDWDSLKDLP